MKSIMKKNPKAKGAFQKSQTTDFSGSLLGQGKSISLSDASDGERLTNTNNKNNLNVIGTDNLNSPKSPSASQSLGLHSNLRSGSEKSITNGNGTKKDSDD